jgi:hypothetical protein
LKNNNEIRFPVTSELKGIVDSLYSSKFSELKRTSFYQKIFLLGFNDVLSQLMKQEPKQVLINLMKIKK